MCVLACGVSHSWLSLAYLAVGSSHYWLSLAYLGFPEHLLLSLRFGLSRNGCFCVCVCLPVGFRPGAHCSHGNIESSMF